MKITENSLKERLSGHVRSRDTYVEEITGRVLLELTESEAAAMEDPEEYIVEEFSARLRDEAPDGIKVERWAVERIDSTHFSLTVKAFDGSGWDDACRRYWEARV